VDKIGGEKGPRKNKEEKRGGSGKIIIFGV